MLKLIEEVHVADTVRARDFNLTILEKVLYGVGSSMSQQAKEFSFSLQPFLRSFLYSFDFFWERSCHLQDGFSRDVYILIAFELGNNVHLRIWRYLKQLCEATYRLVHG